MNAPVLYLRGLVQAFKTDDALVKHIATAARMNRKQRGGLAEVLAGSLQ